MKLWTALLPLILLALARPLPGQAPSTQQAFSGTLNVFSASAGGSAGFTIQGFFNDLSGQYASPGVAVGDIFWDVSCNRWEVMAINSSAGGIINAEVRDVNGAGAVATGVGAIMHETDSHYYPVMVAGISQTLQACIDNHFKQLLEGSAGGGRTKYSLSGFTGALLDLPAAIPAMEADYVLLRNGIELTEGWDYTVSGPSQVTLVVPADNEDFIFRTY